MNRRCLLFAGLLLAAVGFSAPAQDAATLLHQLDAGFTQVFEKAAPSVVVIEATRTEDEDAVPPFDFFFRQDHPIVPDRRRDKNWTLPEPPVKSEGCGFVVRPNGYILTNRHVIASSTQVEVRGYDGRRWTAAVVATDERTDIAVLKVEAADLIPVIWGDSEALRVGQLVCAIGAPFSQDFSFTCGWVSGKGRGNLLTPPVGRSVYEDYIQTDAFINPGNSGGPLLDVEGRVVGMNTLINGLGRGLAFAIPATLLRTIGDQLIDTGKVRWAWLGVRVTSLESSKTLRAQFPGVDHGVVIYTVEAGSPAAASDLQPGDLITALDATPLRSARDLVRFVQKRKVGETISAAVIRRGKNLTVPLTTGELTDESARIVPVASAPSPALALTKTDLGLKLIPGKPGGVEILEIAPGSVAARVDLKVGDRITDIGTELVDQPEAAQAAIEKAFRERPEKGVLLQFFRNGKKSWVVIERTAP